MSIITLLVPARNRLHNEIIYRRYEERNTMDTMGSIRRHRLCRRSGTLSHTHVQTWKKIATFAETSAQLGLKISRAKTKLLSANTTPDAKNA